jgi:mRNA interferase HigB
MHIITKARLKDFWTKHPKAESGLLHWFKITSNSNWENFNDVRQTFEYVDLVKGLTVFNIGGNKYRLITKIVFTRKKVYIREVLLHSEYDKDNWKNDPWSF